MHDDSRGKETDGRAPSGRSFGLVFAAFFALVALLPLASGRAARGWALPPSALLLALALARPSFLAGAARVWAAVGLALHQVSSPVVLALFYFAVLTPFALTARLFRPDPLGLRRMPEAGSYWVDLRGEELPPGGMDRQF